MQDLIHINKLGPKINFPFKTKDKKVKISEPTGMLTKFIKVWVLDYPVKREKDPALFTFGTKFMNSEGTM